MEKREGEGEQLPGTVPYVANAFNVYHSNQCSVVKYIKHDKETPTLCPKSGGGCRECKCPKPGEGV